MPDSLTRLLVITKTRILSMSRPAAVSSYFQKASLTFTSMDYAEVLSSVKKGTFVYLDPPYDPVSDTANFTGYAKGGFGRPEQIRLRECCDELNRRGNPVYAFQLSTDFIREQYAAYDITIVKGQTRHQLQRSQAGAGRRGGCKKLQIKEKAAQSQVWQ